MWRVWVCVYGSERAEEAALHRQQSWTATAASEQAKTMIVRRHETG